jgi:biopolymer transport protein ExbD
MLTPVSKIEITPLVGLALVLVIVFMVTAPLMMTPSDLNIDLPKAKTVEAKSESNITISVSQENEIAINERMVLSSHLENELSKLLEKDNERLVVIRADKNLSHKVVLELLSICKKAGAKRLAIGTLQRNRV